MELLIGVITLVFTALPAVQQAIIYVRRRSQYEALQKSIETQWKRLSDLSDEKDGWNQILVLLEVSDVIMPQVLQRFWRRFALLLAIAIGSAAITGATFTVENGRLTRTDVFDCLLALANWGLPFATFLRTNLFTSDERKFLRNVGRLHDLFYENVIAHVIDKFNEQCDNSLSMKRYAKKSEEEFKVLRARFTSQLGAAPRLPVGSEVDGS
jgi:hypothetical protein